MKNDENDPFEHVDWEKIRREEREWDDAQMQRERRDFGGIASTSGSAYLQRKARENAQRRAGHETNT